MTQKLEMFANRLRKVSRHLDKQARRQGVTCYRVYDHDLPEFPFCIERYEEKVNLAEYRRRHGMDAEAHDAWLESCVPVISEVLEVGPSDIFSRERGRKAGRQGQYEKRASEGEFFTAHEGGLSFLVNLTDYLDTGLFLDHRITRDRVRSEASGKDVLNLFAYTGSFSVYAAAGGARSVVSVDLSKTYLGWAARNMELNGFGGQGRPFPCRYEHADVLQYLDTVPAAAFDLVVLDPPTFSNSKRMEDFLDIQRDHVDLINRTLYTVRPGGVIYFSTNFTKFQLDASSIRSGDIRDITKATTPFDFEGKLRRWCYRIAKV